MSNVDEFVPRERAHNGYGRTQQWIITVLRAEPGRWFFYPFPVAYPQSLANTYRVRYPGTEWAVNEDGRLGARWIGE